MFFLIDGLSFAEEGGGRLFEVRRPRSRGGRILDEAIQRGLGALKVEQFLQTSNVYRPLTNFAENNRS